MSAEVHALSAEIPETGIDRWFVRLRGRELQLFQAYAVRRRDGGIETQAQ